MKLSIVLATHNEEKNLKECLSSIKDISDEIIIVDGRSTDRTVEIGKSFGAIIEVTDNPPIFHINKQKAIEMSKGEWILQLDADEVVTDILKKEILNIVNSTVEISGYYLPRKNYFLGHWMRKGGQYPDYVIRLFKNGKGKFPCKSVHEQITIDGKVGYFRSPLHHYPYKTIGEYWEKAERYSLLVAQNMKQQGKIGVLKVLDYMLHKPIVTFWTLFIRHLGFFDGIYGFLFAFLSGVQYPLAIIKYFSLK